MRNAIRFEPDISVGMVPDSDDLDQLAELGYRTLVDVRDSEEKFGGFVQKRAEEKGFKYVNIPIRRDAITLPDVLGFYHTIFDHSNAPYYVFSRFGKKPLAFLVLLKAVAADEPLVGVFRRASRYGIDLRGDLCLQDFLVEFFNGDQKHAIHDAVRTLRPDLLEPPDHY